MKAAVSIWLVDLVEVSAVLDPLIGSDARLAKRYSPRSLGAAFSALEA